jgi:hypothetical protein
MPHTFCQPSITGAPSGAGWQPAPHSGKPQTALAFHPGYTLLEYPIPPHITKERNAMQQFIAKFEKDIQGVMSGFDRVLFRGSLRRLTHSKGMKWYLAENNILLQAIPGSRKRH